MRPGTCTCHLDPRLYLLLDSENHCQTNPKIVFPMSGNIPSAKMNLFYTRNLIFEVTRDRRCQNDKFVTVWVPDTKTNANLIFFISKLVSFTRGLPGARNPNFSWWNLFWSAGDAKRLQLQILRCMCDSALDVQILRGIWRWMSTFRRWVLNFAWSFIFLRLGKLRALSKRCTKQHKKEQKKPCEIETH